MTAPNTNDELKDRVDILGLLVPLMHKARENKTLLDDANAAGEVAEAIEALITRNRIDELERQGPSFALLNRDRIAELKGLNNG